MIRFDKKPHRRHSFNPNWKSIGFVEENEKALCVLCGTSVVFRSSSVNRHFQSRHALSGDSEINKKDVIDCAIAYYNRFKVKNNVDTWFKEMSGMHKLSKNAKPSLCQDNDKKLSIGCSFALANFLAKKGKPMTDGDYVKEAFITCAKILFDDLNNKKVIMSRLENLPSSSEIMERRIRDINEIVQQERARIFEESPIYSVLLMLGPNYSSPRVKTGGSLSMAVRVCNNDSIFEKLCCVKHFEAEITSRDVLAFVHSGFETNKMSSDKVFSFITDNSDVFTDTDDGFLTLFEQELDRTLLKYHCLLDLDRLLFAISHGNLNLVINSVGKIVSCLMAESSTIENMFEPYSEKIRHTQFNEIAWLGDGKVLEIFASQLNTIKSLVTGVSKEFIELQDVIWVTFLMYTSDLVTHLHDLQQSLNKEGHNVLDLFQTWITFIEKTKSFIRDISNEKYVFFPRLRDFCCNNNIISGECLKYTEILMHEFSERLDHLYAYEKILPFLVEPHTYDSSNVDLSLFPMIKVDWFEQQFVAFKQSDYLDVQFAELRKDLLSKEVNRCSRILQCWSSVPNRFACIKQIAFALLSAFGSATPGQCFNSGIMAPQPIRIC